MNAISNNNHLESTSKITMKITRTVYTEKQCPVVFERSAKICQKYYQN